VVSEKINQNADLADAILENGIRSAVPGWLLNHQLTVASYRSNSQGLGLGIPPLRAKVPASAGSCKWSGMPSRSDWP
jgi:hypothetical protein